MKLALQGGVLHWCCMTCFNHGRSSNLDEITIAGQALKSSPCRMSYQYVWG